MRRAARSAPCSTAPWACSRASTAAAWRVQHQPGTPLARPMCPATLQPVRTLQPADTLQPEGTLQLGATLQRMAIQRCLPATQRRWACRQCKATLPTASRQLLGRRCQVRDLQTCLQRLLHSTGSYSPGPPLANPSRQALACSTPLWQREIHPHLGSCAGVTATAAGSQAAMPAPGAAPAAHPRAAAPSAGQPVASGTLETPQWPGAQAAGAAHMQAPYPDASGGQGCLAACSGCWTHGDGSQPWGKRCAAWMRL